uniref:Uncharacterized protein n=1 Tax=Anguilla anguilla TaxID=7936 RepID=A0A0E9VYT7_ANGAN
MLILCVYLMFLLVDVCKKDQWGDIFFVG